MRKVSNTISIYAESMTKGWISLAGKRKIKISKDSAVILTPTDTTDIILYPSGIVEYNDYGTFRKIRIGKRNYNKIIDAFKQLG